MVVQLREFDVLLEVTYATQIGRRHQIQVCPKDLKLNK